MIMALRKKPTESTTPLLYLRTDMRSDRLISCELLEKGGGYYLWSDTDAHLMCKNGQTWDCLLSVPIPVLSCVGFMSKRMDEDTLRHMSLAFPQGLLLTSELLFGSGQSF